MLRKRLIVVGAKAEPNGVTHYGGVLTLSNGLVDYAGNAGLDVDVVNTLRAGFVRVSLAERIKRGLWRAAELAGKLRSRGVAGVIIFSGADGSFYERVLLSAICRMFRVPCVLSLVSGQFFAVSSSSSLRKWTTRWLLRIPNRLAASGSKWVSLFRELGIQDERVALIHYWLPRSAEARSTVRVARIGEPVRFVFIGWMIEEKGIHEILSALASILGTYDCRFTFIGAGALLDTVRQTILESRWDERIVAAGWVSPEQLEKELAQAHVFVLPSHAEGFPMSLIEALSSGLPAICTDVGGISDSLHDGVNGFLIPPKDAPALARAMEFYLQHPEAIRAHSEAALAVCRANHDPNVNCRMLLDCISVAH